MIGCGPTVSSGTRKATTGREPSPGAFTVFRIGERAGRSSVIGISVPSGASTLSVTSTPATSPL